MSEELQQEAASVFEDCLWHHNGWEARVIKNEDDDGWAVAMTQDGQAEPSLVGPWTMGRDKKNPKPLDVSAFNTSSRLPTKSCGGMSSTWRPSCTRTSRSW